MTRRLELIGQRFGKLEVVEDCGHNRFNHSMWRCACDCGNETTTSGINLRNEHSQSCGCVRDLKKETHGHTTCDWRSPEYSVWGSMIQRCHNPNTPAYVKYGAAGIVVHSSWRGRGGFIAFLGHIGQRPSLKHSVDRIDGTKGYEPGNVRWATDAEQSRNLKSNIWCEINGESLILADVAKKYGINSKTLRHRLKRMSAQEAATRPVKSKAQSLQKVS